jgi:hypothetical protein
MLSISDLVAVPKHVLLCVFEKGSVPLNLDAEIYFGLDKTGTRKWQVLTTASNIEMLL